MPASTNNSNNLFNFTAGSGYISLPVTIDAPTLQNNALQAIASALPGWIPRESHIEVLLLEQFAAMCAETAQVAAQVPQAIFVFFGSLVGINPIPGAPAQSLTTWVMQDTAGYTVPIGTQVGYAVLGTQTYVFETSQTFTVPAGQDQAVGVPIIASTNGTSYNSLPPQQLVLLNPLSFVAMVYATTTSSGGVDPETQAQFLNRLSSELQLLAPRPILPSDYAGLSKNIAGVARAMAVSGLSPGRTLSGCSFTNGQPTLTCATANFTQYDVGRSLSDTTNPTYIGGTILSIPNTTIASGSNNLSLPQTTLFVSSTTGFPGSGTATIQLDANDYTTVSYTGTSGGNSLTGVTGGSGTLTTGMAVYCGSQCTMSGNASHNSSVGGDTVVLGDLANQERTVFVAAVDANGNALPSNEQTELQQYLVSKREVNFVVNMGTPTYSTIDVSWVGYSVPGFNLTTVQQAANAAVQAYLSPANWGGGNQAPPIWDPTATVVRYNTILAILGSTPGMQYISSLTINIDGHTPGTADITLPGDAPLTKAGTIIGSLLQGS